MVMHMEETMVTLVPKDSAIAENLQIKFRKLYTYLKLLYYEKL